MAESLKSVVNKEYLEKQIKNYDSYRNLDKENQPNGPLLLDEAGMVAKDRVYPAEVTVEGENYAELKLDGKIEIADKTYEFAQKDNTVNTVNGSKGDVEIDASNLKYDDTQTIKEVVKQLLADMKKKDDFPIGTILPYLGSTPPDETWEICTFGKWLYKEGHEELYAILGDKYNPEDVGIQEDRFYLPNLQGRFLEGEGTHELGEFVAAGIPDSQGGTGVHCTASGSGVGNGAFYWGSPPGGCTYGGVTGNVQSYGVTFKLSNGEWDTENNKYKSASGKVKVYGKSDTVQPLSIVVNYIMKVSHYTD